MVREPGPEVAGPPTRGPPGGGRMVRETGPPEVAGPAVKGPPSRGPPSSRPTPDIGDVFPTEDPVTTDSPSKDSFGHPSTSSILPASRDRRLLQPLTPREESEEIEIRTATLTPRMTLEAEPVEEEGDVEPMTASLKRVSVLRPTIAAAEDSEEE